MIEAFTSAPHYLAHLAPIWQALPEEERGDFWVRPELLNMAAALGIDARITHGGPGGLAPIMVASHMDLNATRNRAAIYVEHGIGQSYSSRHPSYPGGKGRERVILFLDPSRRVARKNEAAYPGVPSVPVGVPKMDPWHSGELKPHGGAVAISFHFDCHVCPESRTAFPHYERILRQLAASFPEVIGHGHPRIFERIAPIYRAAGIEPVRNFAEVLDRASIYAVDNSSTLYEFASTDRPVVVLNAPWYRRNIDHGLRFWDASFVGLRCDEPSELIPMLHLGLIDPLPTKQRRREIIAGVYHACDGHAAERAASAIAELGAKV